MSTILDYYQSIYGEVPKWVQNFYQMDSQCLEDYTTLRNSTLKSKHLHKYEMDYIIVAVNAYRNYEDSMYMHSLAALNSGGKLEELQSTINLVEKLKDKENRSVSAIWSTVLARLQIEETALDIPKLSREFQLIIICCVYIATLQSHLSLDYLREFINRNYNMKYLQDGILACLLTAGIPVLFEFTKAVEEARG